MGLTVLDLVRQFCYEINEPAPLVFISAVTPDILQIKGLLNAVHRDLRETKAFPQQKKIHTFSSTSTTRTKYPLPIDFYAAILDTQYDRSKSLQTIANVSDGMVNYRRYGIGSSSYHTETRIFGIDSNPSTLGGQFEIEPAAAVGTVFSFEYFTSCMYTPKYWAPGEPTAVGDYCFASGNFYISQTNANTGATIPSHTSGSVSDGGVTWTYVNLSYETILKDTDLSLFDDELVILGLKSQWYRAKGLDDRWTAEYENKKESAQIRFRGKNRGTFYSKSSLPRYAPATDGSWIL